MFCSKKTADLVNLPVSVARFAATTGLSGRGRQEGHLPGRRRGRHQGQHLKSLAVYASYDYGQAWKQVIVINGKVKVKNPAKGKASSFHAKFAGKKASKATVSIYNAFYGK
ncbi:hypothetical protein [Streptomyces sp. NPDC095817]|uniref:hypothetical protein n=1 Tax=Streptomyces sp. NPDC095817 TaxID=3155082 RepID=UPI00332E945F